MYVCTNLIIDIEVNLFKHFMTLNNAFMKVKRNRPEIDFFNRDRSIGLSVVWIDGGGDWDCGNCVNR